MHKRYIPSITILLLIFACSSNKPVPPAPEKKTFEKMMQTKNELMAKGIPAAFVTSTSKELQVAIDKTELECRAQLARAMENKVGTMQKSFAEEAGQEMAVHFQQVTTSISSRILSGTTMSKVDYDEKDGMYRAYGLMIMDPKIFKDALLGELQAQEATKIRVIASKGYKELDAATRAFDEYKKDQLQ
jgi:hypothetical protein